MRPSLLLNRKRISNFPDKRWLSLFDIFPGSRRNASPLQGSQRNYISARNLCSVPKQTHKNSKAVSKSTLSIYKNSTERILSSKVGCFDSRAWHEAEWTIRFWNRQNTVESVRLTFALLDRFIEEYYQQLQAFLAAEGSIKDITLPAVLTTANLNFAVNNWRLCAKNLKTTAQRSAVPNPTNILQKIDHYRYYHMTDLPGSAKDGFPRPLTPNVYTYTMVLDALAFGQPDLGINSVERQSLEPKNKSTPDAYGNIGWDFSNTPAPHLAEMILERLMKDYKNDKYLRPSIVTFNSVINVWARSRMPEAPEKAEALLRQIQDLSDETDWEDLQPTDSTYGSLINTWANSGNKDAPRRAAVLLEEMKASERGGGYPNGEIYLSILKAWGRSQDLQAGKRASELLQEMVDRYQQLKASGEDRNVAQNESHFRGAKPPLKCFLAVMDIYAKRGDAKRASIVLDNLQSLFEKWGHDRDLCPNTAAFNCVLRAWGRSRSRDAAANAEKILQRMQDLAESTGNADIAPDLVSYNAVLHTLSRTHANNAIKRAERILKVIEETPGIAPDLVSYNMVLHLWARSNRKDAAEHAEQILRRMWQLYQDNAVNFMPDNVSYNTCIDAWSRSKIKTAAERAEALFREMQQQHRRTNNSRLKPTRVSFGSLITAYAKRARLDHDAAAKAQKIFDEMQASGIRSTNVEYNSTIHAWAATGNVDRAEMLIDQMLEDFSNGNVAAKPDTHSFSSLINGLAKARSRDPWITAKRAESIVMRMEKLSNVLGDEVKPNVFSFNSVLDCYAKCRMNESAAEHAEKILNHMHALYDSGNTNVKPNVVSVTTAMNCWVNSRSSKSPDRVETLFQELQRRYKETGDRDLKPSQYTYNALICAYAKDTQRQDALDKALGYFDDMIDQFRSTGDLDVRPGPLHFSVILGAFSQRGMAEEAEAFLSRVFDICSTYETSGPDNFDISSSFNGVIGAHARSQTPGSAEKAEATLRRMLEPRNADEPIEANPNVISYTSVLLAWSLAASEGERRIAVQRSEALLKEMIAKAEAGNRIVMPNQVTFGTFLQVIARSELPDKRQRAQQVLQMMKHCGVRPDTFILKIVESSQ